MAEITPAVDEPPWDSFGDDVRTARNALRIATLALNDLTEKVLETGGDSVRDLPVRAADLSAAMKKAAELQEKYNDWLARSTGALRAGDFDLDAALEEIRGRLDLLRGCDAGDLAAGGPDPA